MHHSRFCTVIIDCQTKDVATAAQFWSQAFGRKVVEGNPGDDPSYLALAMRPGEILCQVQAVSHESRAHLDIETDDLDAEVKRLVALGAKEVERHQYGRQEGSWVVMQAPTGQRFCVGRPKTQDFPAGANRWE
jgi:predicted enzyme related to lactoylglutathione lyase